MVFPLCPTQLPLELSSSGSARFATHYLMEIPQAQLLTVLENLIASALMSVNDGATKEAQQMPRDHNRVIASRQAELDVRLDRKWQPETSEPVFTGTNICYQISQRIRAIGCGGLGIIQKLVKEIGLRQVIDTSLHVLKRHLPYYESDHVLNLVYNVLTGGERLEDVKARRHDLAYLDALGAQRIPDATTAGDFLRRFSTADIEALMDGINTRRCALWRSQPEEKRRLALIDVDGTIQKTTGVCKQGADFSYDGQWGYGPLVITLANSGEVLFIVNRGANRPSHDGAPLWMQKAIDWAMRAGFQKVRFRGDTDFSLTAHFDGWTNARVEFDFGIDANSAFVTKAEAIPQDCWKPLSRPAKRTIATAPRDRQPNCKEQIVKQRGYENLRLQAEHVAEVEYTPTKCGKIYRMVILRKTIAVEKGQTHLFDQTRYFFYVSNIAKDSLSTSEVVFENNARCNQENLIEQLKNGVHATNAPAAEFNANWAYMVICTLAWNLKAWLGLVLPAWLGARDLLRMEFRRFVAEVICVPAQVLSTGRQLVFRLLACPKQARLLIEGTIHLKGGLACGCP